MSHKSYSPHSKCIYRALGSLLECPSSFSILLIERERYTVTESSGLETNVELQLRPTSVMECIGIAAFSKCRVRCKDRVTRETCMPLNLLSNFLKMPNLT